MAMPTFSREEIVHLGDLARIALTDEEITRLQGELNVIADSINKVQEVASDDVPPTANPVPLEAYLRPDVAETPLTQEEALAGGPKTEAGMVGIEVMFTFALLALILAVSKYKRQG